MENVKITNGRSDILHQRLKRKFQDGAQPHHDPEAEVARSFVLAHGTKQNANRPTMQRSGLILPFE
jgi:hypothetical protein